MTFIGFVLSLIALVAAIAVVVNRNPLYSALALVVNLLAVAGLYALLEAHFLAVSQIVVYAGAIMVLVLFVLMLLNLKDEPRRRFVIVRAIIAITIGCWIFSTAFSSMVTQLSGLSTHSMQENMRRSEGTVKAIGEELFSRYIVQFELSSLVLLIGIVGAVMLAKRKQVALAPRNEGTGEKGKNAGAQP